MLGLGDFWVSLVFVLCICSTLLCVVYGAVNWNKDGEPTPEQVVKKKRWEKEERDIDEKL